MDNILEWVLAGLIGALIATIVVHLTGCATYRPDGPWTCRDGSQEHFTGCFKIHRDSYGQD